MIPGSVAASLTAMSTREAWSAISLYRAGSVPEPMNAAAAAAWPAVRLATQAMFIPASRNARPID